MVRAQAFRIPREKMRPEPHLHILAEIFSTERGEKPLQIRERDALVDQEPFDLVEHERMARVNGVRAVNFARNDDRQRRLILLHDPHLPR